MMTAAEAEKIKDFLVRTSTHLHDTEENPRGVTHWTGCDCQFLRALDAVIAAEAEIAELKTPSGYWDVDGEPLCYEDGTTFSGSPVESFAELERWATQCLFDDGERIVARPYRAMRPEKYIVRWVGEKGEERVKLERAEQSQHPIGDLREEEE